MQSARCNQTNSIYGAQQFASLPPNEMFQIRPNLVCPECERAAFFRNETLNGREACFGARPHADWCSLKATQSTAKAGESGWSQDVSTLDEQRIVVDFSYGAQAADGFANPGETPIQLSQRRRSGGASGSANKVTHRRLSSILRELSLSHEFSQSQQLVEIGGIGAFRANEFFASFDAVTLAHLNGLHGFYGQIVSAYFWPNMGTLWLNSGGRGDFSIGVPWELIPGFFRRFKINETRELNGATVLLFGVLQISQHWKKYVMLDDLDHIAVEPTRRFPEMN